MKVIKNKYTIEVEDVNSFLTTEIEISKDVYNEQIENLDELVENFKGTEDEFFVFTDISDMKYYTAVTTVYRRYSTTITLTHKIIKDGYRFTNKNERK